jgi:prepilin-type N-terminal cleavage/methylation domain-containing protein
VNNVAQTLVSAAPRLVSALLPCHNSLHTSPTFRVIIDVMQPRVRRRSRGFSLIELLIVIAIILIILTIAVPKFGAARQGASEMAVVKEIQTINTTQSQYLSQFGRYATTLAELGPPTSGGPGPAAADLIPASQPAGDKDGYTFTMAATPQGYTINANPKVYNTTGRQTFYSDQSMVVRHNWSAEPANASSPEL